MGISARNLAPLFIAFVCSQRFLVLFVFAPLVLFFGSLVVYCLRIFVLRVRFLFCISYIKLCMLVIFRVSSLLCSLVRFTVKFKSFCICLLLFAAPLRFTSFSFTDCRKSRNKVVLLEDFKRVKAAPSKGNTSEERWVCRWTGKFSNDKNQNQKLLSCFSCHFLFDTLTVKRWSPAMVSVRL